MGKTHFPDNSAEYVIATLLTDAFLISAQVNDTRGIKLFQNGTLQELSQPLNFLPLSLSVAINEGRDDDCFHCLTECSNAARSVRAAEENVAVAKLTVAGVACGGIGLVNPSLAAICVAGALVQFYADINAAKQKYLQEEWKCGYSICKRLNGTPCRGRDR